MKKLSCMILAVCMLLVLAACGEAKAAEAETKEWTRQGTFEDENGNQLFVNLSDTEGYEGWGVSLVPADGEAVGWIIQQEGDALRGDLNAWDEEADPFNVTVTEEGEDGLMLEVEDGATYHFTPMDIPEAVITVNVNTEGWGYIAYAEGEETPEMDPDYPAQSACIGLAEPAVHTFLAEPEAGNLFVKWTKNGEDYSTDPQITVMLDESAEYIAVFEEDPDWQNPVMNFVGEYQCGQTHAKVECWGFDEAFITITWDRSASEMTRWILVGRLDTDTQMITYEGAGKADLVCDEEGEVQSETPVYDDGTGTIAFHEDGSFSWHEDQSETGEDMEFVWSPVTDGSPESMPDSWEEADSAEAAAEGAGVGYFMLPESGMETEDWQVRCFGNEDGRAMKAIWSSDNFSYGILVRGQGDIRDTYGLGPDDIKALVDTIG